MIKIKKPRFVTVGKGLLIGKEIPEAQVKAIIEKELLRRSIICESVISESS